LIIKLGVATSRLELPNFRSEVLKYNVALPKNDPAWKALSVGKIVKSEWEGHAEVAVEDEDDGPVAVLSASKDEAESKTVPP
ncbi:hypothetical protein JCM10212_002095, partial [Sporobolomyces blumeae]